MCVAGVVRPSVPRQLFDVNVVRPYVFCLHLGEARWVGACGSQMCLRGCSPHAPFMLSAIRLWCCLARLPALQPVMFCSGLRVFVCCVWAAVAAPAVNVIAESPGASAGTVGQDLRLATAKIKSFAASVRAQTRRMSLEAQHVLDAQSTALSFLNARSVAPAAGFVTLRDAHSDSNKLMSMLRGVTAHAGGAHVGQPPAEEPDAMPDVDSSLRKLFLDVGKKFADAAGAGQLYPASFLQPVDANRLRKSLLATEPMRSSSPTVVSVISSEDVSALRREAIYKGLAAQTDALHNAFEADLVALGAS